MHNYSLICLLYRVINNNNDQHQLQNDLQQQLEIWEKKWQMQFNADECFTIHLTKKRKTAEFNYILHNHILEVTKDSKYLGVTFSSDLSWTSHINNISAKANRTIGNVIESKLALRTCSPPFFGSLCSDPLFWVAVQRPKKKWGEQVFRADFN